MKLTLNGIHRVGRQRCKKLKAFCGLKVLIFSRKHMAYWRVGAAGYTLDPVEAGVYDFADAYAHTMHCGPEKRIEFEILCSVPN